MTAPTAPVDSRNAIIEAQLAALLDSPEHFQHWLAGFFASVEVGTPQSLFICPIANFLAANGIECPVVGPDIARAILAYSPRTGPRYMLPAWAVAFIDRVDRGPYEQVTAGAALALLHELTREGAT